MGLLTATIDDVQPRGRLLPEGEYVVTVEEVKSETTERGVQLVRRYGNIRTRGGAVEIPLADGTTFRIGNRKLFKRSWIDHSNPEAAKIGNSEIKKEAMSAGLMDVPTKENPKTDLPFEDWFVYGEQLVGKEVPVRVRHKTREGKDVDPQTGKRVMVTDAEVVDWVLP